MCDAKFHFKERITISLNNGQIFGNQDNFFTSFKFSLFVYYYVIKFKRIVFSGPRFPSMFDWESVYFIVYLFYF